MSHPEEPASTPPGFLDKLRRAIQTLQDEAAGDGAREAEGAADQQPLSVYPSSPAAPLAVPLLVEAATLPPMAEGRRPAPEQPAPFAPRPGAPVTYFNITPEVVSNIAGIATNAWRTHMKLIDPVTKEARDEATRRILRHVEAMIEGLKQFGLEIEDPVGRAYDSGLPLKVISFEPKDSLHNETIIETIRPAIRYRGNLLQIGEVIVGIPAPSPLTPAT